MVVEDSDPDTSDDEIHSRNTLGKVPLWWYDEFDHMGYDLSGKKVGLLVWLLVEYLIDC